MRANNPETIYFAGSGDWTQARLITVSGSARTVPMSHRDKLILNWTGPNLVFFLSRKLAMIHAVGVFSWKQCAWYYIATHYHHLVRVRPEQITDQPFVRHFHRSRGISYLQNIHCESKNTCHQTPFHIFAKYWSIFNISFTVRLGRQFAIKKHSTTSNKRCYTA